MRIALCEDEPRQIDALYETILRWVQKMQYEDITIDTFANAEELHKQICAGRVFDLLLLDIEFPTMSGYDLACEVRKRDSVTPLVFITNTSDYMQKGYEVGAYRYLKKPALTSEIECCLNYGFTHSLLRTDNSFTIKCKGITTCLRYGDIAYFESSRHNTKAITITNKAYGFTCLNFRGFCDDLPRNMFVRCHRSFAINIAHVYRYTSEEIEIHGGHSVKIGPSYKTAITVALDRHFNGSGGVVQT